VSARFVLPGLYREASSLEGVTSQNTHPPPDLSQHGHTIAKEMGRSMGLGGLDRTPDELPKITFFEDTYLLTLSNELFRL
jgi:hypothetical protein